MNSDTRTRNILIIVGGVFVVAVVIFIVIAVINNVANQNKKDSVYISNLSSCSKNMQTEVETAMRTNMYRTIKAANDYNKQDSLPSYTATLREGSCTEKDIAGVDGAEEVKESTAILDIPDAKQSWAITYHWAPNGTAIESDLGTIVTPSCLPKDKLIYGDFKCENVMSLSLYGTDKADPILRYMPYAGAGFNLSYNPDTKEVTANIELKQSQKDNQVLIDNLKKQVVYWFQKRELDINSYTVTYVLNIEEAPVIHYDD